MVNHSVKRLSGNTLPPRFADLPDPPPEAWLVGSLPRLPAVGIVGTRHPTADGERFAFELAHALSAAGAVVLSGGALGIDAAAHRGALAAGGLSVVVAPAGFYSPYPEQNSGLFTEVVAAGGGYLSLAPAYERAHLASFFRRNAILACLCDVLVLVQAPFRSGARNAAAAARKLGRPLLVVPSAPWEAKGRGCIAELRLGGEAIDSSAQVIRSLVARGAALIPHQSWAAREEAPRRGSGAVGCAGERESTWRAPDQLELPTVASLTVQTRAVLGAVAAGARSVDQICETTGLSARAVHMALLELELEGVVGRGPEGVTQAG